MIWHGCRHGRNHQPPLEVRAGLLAMLVMFAINDLQAADVAAPGSSAASRAATAVDRRVELHWKSDSPRLWAGTIQWAEHESPAGSAPETARLIGDPVNLTPGPILSGSILPSDRGGLRFGPPARLLMLPSGEGELTASQTTRGGISFRVRADATERLVLRLDGGDASSSSAMEIALADLDAGDKMETSLGNGASVWVAALRDGPLRVRLGGGGTVLWTSEVVDVTVQGDFAGQSEADDAELVLECLTYTASDHTLTETEVWPAKIIDGRLACDKPQWTAPAVEGAYRVRWQLRAKAPARGSLSSSLSPVALATTWTQSLSEAMPASFSSPFHLPLRPSLPAISSKQNFLFQTEFSIAVVDKQLPLTQHDSAAASDGSGPWRVIGKAEPRDAALSVSRLLPRQTSDWLAAAAVSPGTPRAPSHDGKRLTVLEPETQLEYAVPLSEVGQRHRALIRVPTAAAMQLAVELLDGVDTTDAAELQSGDHLGPGLVITRSDFNGDGKPWYVASIDFWPRSVDTRILLTNRSTDQAASFESIEIHVFDRDAQPPFPSEAPPATRLAAIRLELSDLLQQFGERGAPTLDSPLDYQSVWVAGNRLVETLIREGYGGAVLTVSSDGATCYPSEMTVTDASWNANWATAGGPVDALELLLRLFDRASLKLVPCIRPSSPLLALEQAILRDRAGHASIAAPSPLGGQLGKWSFDGPPISAFGIYNPTHPAVAQQVADLLGELRQRCDDHHCVSTIGVIVDERTYLRLPPVSLTDPHTLDAFHASLGEAAPPRATLANWIQNAGTEAFEQWRGQRTEALFREILSQLNNQSLLVMSLDCTLPANLVELERDPRILTARLHRRSLIEPLGLRIRDEACNASVSVNAGSPQWPWSHDVGVFHQPLTQVRHGVSAHGAHSPQSLDESVGTQRGAGLTPLLDQEESSLAFSQLLNRSDRMMIAIGGGAMNQPASEVRRRSLRCFSLLPPVGMADVHSEKNMMSAVRVRHVRHQGKTYIYAANQTRWPISVDMTLSRSAAIIPLGQQSPAATDRVAVTTQPPLEGVPQESLRQISAANRWQPTLAAGELLAIRISGEDVDIVTWKASFAGEEEQLRLIHSYVRDAVGSLARLVKPEKLGAIENSDFEQDASKGIPGWLTAQYPPGCVAIDPSVAFQGKQSIRLTGQQGHAGGSWIVSQVISPPQSCRLAVSVRLRGEPSAAARSLPPLVIRMALEGTVGGTPIRKSTSITVPRDGNWSEPAERLEIALLPSVPVESLRLTIDLMSGGVVWIDEVSLFDQFMTSSEKTQLDHLVFLAAGGASRGDWTSASRLLDSHWAHDLAVSRGSEKAHGPSHGQRESSTAQAGHQISKDIGHRSRSTSGAKGGKASATKPSRPGIGERLKSWLPRPVRF